MKTWHTWLVASLLAGAVATLHGLGAWGNGIWTAAEYPTIARTLAATGAALDGLLRAPPLPGWLRTLSYNVHASPEALRVPHLVFGSACVAMAYVAARHMLRWSVGASLLAALICAASPALAASTTLVHGNPFIEASVALSVMGGVAAQRCRGSKPRILWIAVAAFAGVIGWLCAGLALGGLIVLATLTLLWDGRVRLLLGSATFAASVAVVWLSWHQGDGYIPVLGAAKDLSMLADPSARRVAMGLREQMLAYAPWSALWIAAAIVGVHPMLARWWGVTMVITLAWSLAYGPVHAPLSVVSALLVTHALLRWPMVAAGPRRVAVVMAVLAVLVLRQDAKRLPLSLVVPLPMPDGARLHWPAHLALPSAAQAMSLGLLAIAAGALLFMLARSPRMRALTVGLPACALAGWQVTTWSHAAVPTVIRAFSMAPSLARLHAWDATVAGAKPHAAYRLRDDSLGLYPAANFVTLNNRADIVAQLQRQEPAAMIVPRDAWAAVHERHRALGFAYFGADVQHAEHVLVANRPWPGPTEPNPFDAVFLENVPTSFHPTSVTWDNRVELVAYQLPSTLVRGTSVEAVLVFRVEKPLSAGAKIYFRMLNGRLSYVHLHPDAATLGVYPGNFWRAGDLIAHRITVDVSLLEPIPGRYDVLVAIEQSKDKNYSITQPEGTRGPYNVVVRGSSRTFAKIGEVSVW